jgi:hypothetical protein
MGEQSKWENTCPAAQGPEFKPQYHQKNLTEK